MPDELIWPKEFFADSFQARVGEGLEHLRQSRVAFVGLARNCAPHLVANLKRLEQLSEACKHWRLHVETNDNTDDTTDVLVEFCRRHGQASFRNKTLHRLQLPGQFAGPRTIALAEYRAACQQWVQINARDSDYVVVIDFDAWGGWSHAGLLSGIASIKKVPGSYGMASISLFQHDFGSGPQWAHYDLWALRGVGQVNCYWDTYRNLCGGWGYSWLPPVGSPPVLVSSAFGGLCIYRTDAYLCGTYDGSDCEHVTFHKSIAESTGLSLYLNPSQRCVMHWVNDATG